MNLARTADLLASIPELEIRKGSLDAEWQGLAQRSDTVVPGNLYVAIRGASIDGHAFVDDAFKNGAAAALVEDSTALSGRPGLIVSNTRRAFSALAAHEYDYPSNECAVVGITGTNGKSTTAWIIAHLLTALGHTTALIGTLGIYQDGLLLADSALTTPDALTLHRLIAEARARESSYIVMEASSHALHQHRVDDVAFDLALFTNLTRDHLDYHETEEEYFQAKRRLFLLTDTGRKARPVLVGPTDDAFGQRLLHEDWSRAAVFSYGTRDDAWARLLTMNDDAHGSVLDCVINGEAVVLRSPYLGLHNAANILGSIVAVHGLGISVASMLPHLPTLPQVPGRLERFSEGGIEVFVDYAHTPDALERVLATTRRRTKGMLWVIVGCGGDRDRGKRPLMGRIAGKGADKVVFTSDNPRTEDPQRIMRDLASGCSVPCHIEPDRRDAIRYALTHATSGDVVLIAGKGHEDYQIIGTEKIHFSDQEEVLKLFRERRL